MRDKLPGVEKSRFRSARARRHAGGHAGAGDDLRLGGYSGHRLSGAAVLSGTANIAAILVRRNMREADARRPGIARPLEEP